MRFAVLVLALASCRQVFGLHELTDKHGDAPPSDGSGSMGDAAGDGSTVDGLPDAPPGTYRVIGHLYGLYGSSIDLANGSDSVMLFADGPFTFLVAVGTSYDVQISGLPPNQTCGVLNATGTSSGPDVTNVIVACRGLDIMCESAVCNVQDNSEHCCETPSVTYSCDGPSQPCPGPVFDCDDAHECGANVCCGLINSSGKLLSSGCAATCTDPDNVILCDPLSATPCPSGTCVPSTLTGAPHGFFQCQ